MGWRVAMNGALLRFGVSGFSEAMAMGADDAVLVTDRVLGGADADGN